MSCPELVSDYNNPKIKWHQTDFLLVICVQLTDVADYYLRIENDCLQFSTETNGKKYYLILQLFGSVVAEKTVHKNIGREIRISLVKGFKYLPWLRLIRSKEKYPLISYNPDYIHTTEPMQINYDIYRFQRYKRENNYGNIMPVVPSSDEDESEDEDDMNILYYD